MSPKLVRFITTSFLQDSTCLLVEHEVRSSHKFVINLAEAFLSPPVEISDLNLMSWSPSIDLNI